ncbi:DMT family transporter [Clostridium sp. BJN0001]|uniref:DMT family transporter n=1 Tax=Clostridium sp. BJN0001 TaxID=2930219 RepID=UPI001FD2CB24|nr:DMT family transporter [Clostridium sp. BJN0001]
MNREKIYTNRRNIILLAAISCFLWGSAYPSIKYGYFLFNIASVNVSSKLIFAGYRFALAGILVIIAGYFFRGKGILKLNRKDFFEVAFLGMIQTTFQYIFFYIGLTYTTGVRGSIINSTGTFVSIILSHFIYKNDKISLKKILGCVIGFAGVILVNIGSKSVSSLGFSFYGEGFVFIAAVFFALSAIYSKHITRRLDTVKASGFQLLIGGIILILSGFSTGGSLHGFTIKSSILLIYMALISSVAFVLWTELLKYNKVGVICVFNFLTPVFGSILSAIFLRENIFDFYTLISLFLVCIGIYVVYND